MEAGFVILLALNPKVVLRKKYKKKKKNKQIRTNVKKCMSKYKEKTLK